MRWLFYELVTGIDEKGSEMAKSGKVFKNKRGHSKLYSRFSSYNGI